VIANDLEKEERFRVPELLSRHSVKSAVNVIIANPHWTFGVLEADSRRPRVFSEEDVRFLQGYANVLALALEQARLEPKEARAILTLADDGPGLPDDAPAGLGLRLIEGLAQQIEGTLRWERGDGARVVLDFPLLGPPGG
jgi:GAF domain-containing protein